MWPGTVNDLQREKKEGSGYKIFKYGVFGLGNKQCELFNKVAKVVDDILVDQGAKLDQCIEDELSIWR